MFTNFDNTVQYGYLCIMSLLFVVMLTRTIWIYKRLTKGLENFIMFLKDISDDELIESKIYKINIEVNENKNNFPTVIKKSWKQFYDEYTRKKTVIPDPYIYFTEEQIVNKAGRRKIIDIIPAMFVSVGVLGTFLGITLGVSDINPQAGSEELQSGINTLLTGMKTAFYSSLAGILFSLVFQFSDRAYFFKKLIHYFEELRYQLDLTIPIKTENDLLDEIAQTQAEQLNDMKTFFADEFITKLTSGITDSLNYSLNPHMEKTNQILDKVAQRTMDTQNEAMNEMVNHFISSLNEVTGDQMKSLGEALQKTVEWQEKVHEEMGSLVDELTNVAEKQAEMAKNTTELTVKMNDYTITLSGYQELLVNSTEELNAITEQNTSLLKEMRQLSEDMNNRYSEAEEQFERRMVQMNETMERISAVGSHVQDLLEETKLTIETLTGATDSINEQVKHNNELRESLISQHEISNQWSIKTQALLEDIAHNNNISEDIQQHLEKLYNHVMEEKTQLENQQQEYSSLIKNSVEQLKEFWHANTDTFVTAKDQFTELNNTLGQSMNDFADHMHRGIQSTFEQFDTELKTAIQHLDKGVGSIQLVIDSMDKEIDSINEQLVKLNEILEDFTTKIEV